MISATTISLSLTISNVSVTTNNTSATINWDTNQDASSQSDYDSDDDPGDFTTEDTTLRRNHSIAVPNLVSCAIYHLRAKSRRGDIVAQSSLQKTYTKACLGSASVIKDASRFITSSSGGELELVNVPGKSLKVNIPPSTFIGALQALQLEKTAAFTGAPAPAGKTSIGGHIYELKALTSPSTSLTSLSSPATITISYDSSEISGIDESSLSTYHWNGTGWVELSGCFKNTLAKTVSCPTSSLSPFALFGTPSDTTAPVISSVSSDSITSSSAIITWTTNEPADAYVEYGPTLSYVSQTPRETDFTTSHSIALSGLSPSAIYHYRTRSSDPAGNFVVSEDNIFVTPAAPPPPPPPPPPPASSGPSGGGGGGGGAPPAVSAPSDFQVLGGENQIVLTWKNPVDVNFVRARVIRKANSALISPNDGEIIYEGDKEEFTDTTAKPGVKYYYAVFSLDRNLSSSILAQASASLGQMSNQSIEQSLAKVVSTPALSLPKFRFVFTRFLQSGSRHEEVKNLQTLLNSLSLNVASQGPGSQGQETDFFGSLTASAVKKFQAKYGIEQLGIVGPKTRAKLNELSGFIPLEASFASGETEAKRLLTGPFAFGYQNDQVKLLQTMLAKDSSVYPEGIITGYYGSLTRKAVERFQQKYGIEQTGLAGPQTRAKLNEIFGR
ncbi:MAG: Peptidoglycan-binding domain 1 protein [Candidatus Giovannonibacteria bacterium GW2011_GWB1_44_23]|uniref:Peptidoglycan-binding domain 1 protein n=1 Tax=Candidatus Giovannonibacteria bacterium GW2011_GWB1_44_23 TaxID=1618652 RepID=A0A0G1I982_9BACT|nr:MAG: Peptidoglycan-binding domain 1 protein [Candidatus Giovannonibacteria bacterium GW2011_GWB1_44_23]